MRRGRAQGPVRLGRNRRLFVYAVAAGVWLSGAAWVALHFFGKRQGEFGPEINPLEPWALKIHGAFAFLTLWSLGLLWGVHVLNGWSAHRRRLSGGGLLGLALFLGLTGYLLYYASGDAFRNLVSWAHWTVGLGAAALFLLHRFAKEAKPRRRGARASAGRAGRRSTSREPVGTEVR